MENNYAKSTLYLLKGIGAGFFALFIKQFTAFITLSFYMNESILDEIPNFALCIVIFISSLFIYSSAFRVVFYFDRPMSEEHIALCHENAGKITKKELFLNKYFVFEAIGAAFISSLFALLGSAFEIAGMFYFRDGRSAYSSGFIPFIVTLAITLLISFSARYEATRWWERLEREKSLDDVTKKSKIIFRTFATIFIYPIATPFLPLFAFMIITLFRTIPLFVGAPLLVGFVVALIFLIILARYIITIRIRKDFYKKTKDIVRQRGYEISEIENPYISLLSSKKKCVFTIKTKKATFNCVVLGRVRRGIPICFTSESHGFFRHRIGTKKHNITFEKHFEYGISGEGKKILIISPSPKHAFIIDPEATKEKRLYNSDKLWDFVAYEGEAFISALDRESLGKYSSVAESDDIKIPRPINFKF